MRYQTVHEKVAVREYATKEGALEAVGLSVEDAHS
jgi:hypothetical protein